eukprot:462333_1
MNYTCLLIIMIILFDIVFGITTTWYKLSSWSISSNNENLSIPLHKYAYGIVNEKLWLIGGESISNKSNIKNNINVISFNPNSTDLIVHTNNITFTYPNQTQIPLYKSPLNKIICTSQCAVSSNSKIYIISPSVSNSLLLFDTNLLSIYYKPNPMFLYNSSDELCILNEKTKRYLFIIGGIYGLRIYDTYENKWNDKSYPMPYTIQATACVFDNNTFVYPLIYTFGGYINNKITINEIYIFDFGIMKWYKSNLIKLPFRTYGHNAILLNNNIYLYGGELFISIIIRVVNYDDIKHELYIKNINNYSLPKTIYKRRYGSFSFLHSKYYNNIYQII